MCQSLVGSDTEAPKFGVVLGADLTDLQGKFRVHGDFSSFLFEADLKSTESGIVFYLGRLRLDFGANGKGSWMRTVSLRVENPRISTFCWRVERGA